MARMSFEETVKWIGRQDEYIKWCKEYASISRPENIIDSYITDIIARLVEEIDNFNIKDGKEFIATLKIEDKKDLGRIIDLLTDIRYELRQRR